MVLWKQELDFIASTRAIAALNTFQQRLEQLHHESNDPSAYRISTIHCCWLWRQQDWLLCHFASKPTACFATFDLPHVCHCLGSIITISLELSNGFYLEGQTVDAIMISESSGELPADGLRTLE